ncbi:hypothetical protein J7I80_00440, partial [Bacillus sp. ISL-41]|uniref:hypothetical protein n=1 Tax=Bacillus sp. ISL-41 TaxID=2819127 RepID=UPI001BEB21EA
VEVSSFCVSGQSAILFDFGPAIEVKERLHRSALQRLSGLIEALSLFLQNSDCYYYFCITFLNMQNKKYF